MDGGPRLPLHRHLVAGETPLGEVVPFTLEAALVVRPVFDRLADLLEQAARLGRAVGLLQQKRIAAARFLAGVIVNQGRIFIERRLDPPLKLQAAGIEEMPFGRIVAGIGLAQLLQHGLRFGEVALSKKRAR